MIIHKKARPELTSVPWPANPFTTLESGYVAADCGDIADDLVAGDSGEYVA